MASMNIVKRKSSLKRHNSSKSTNSNTSSSSDCSKNVRFDLNSTTIKKFYTNSEPISISKNDSPMLSPILLPLNYNGESHIDYSYGNGGFDVEEEEEEDECWFNNAALLPNLLNFDKKFNFYYNNNRKHKHKISNNSRKQIKPPIFNLNSNNNFKENDLNLSDFDLDYDGIDEDEFDTSLEFDGYSSGNDNYEYNNAETIYSTNSIDENNDIINWRLTSTNLPIIPKSLDLNSTASIDKYLNGQNIKLFKLNQYDEDANKITGFLIVNNINFEKLIEIKFTFNNWNNIHYINSSFHRSLTDKYDEFQFVINLDRYKFFLQIKDLLNNQITINLCCRYDVNRETYFDNNYYRNFTLTLSKIITTGEVIQSAGVETKEINNDSTQIKNNNSTNNKNKFTIPSISYIPSLTDSDNNTLNYNNNNENFESSRGLLSAGTQNQSNISNDNKFQSNKKGSYQPINSFSLIRKNNYSHSRTFSDDTDYFNTSPLKHLYHNDTCEFVKKPANNNAVLDIESSPVPVHVLKLLPEPSIGASNSSHYMQASKPQLEQDNAREKISKDIINKDKDIKNRNLNTASQDERSLSAGSDLSVSSNGSFVSLSSFQSDNIVAKRKNDSLSSSDSNTNLKTSLDPIPPSNELKFYNNYVSRDHESSPFSSSEDSEDVIKNIVTSTLPSTIEVYNQDLKSLSPSLSSVNNSIDNQSDEIQSITTDTTFKDNKQIPHATKNIHSSMPNTKNINSNNVNAVNRTFNLTPPQLGPIENIDYQTLLNSYCFYTSSSPVSTFKPNSVTQSSCSSPSSRLFL